MLIDDTVLDALLARAAASPRLRMNLNLHPSPDAPSQRLINAMLPGTVVPLHRHPHTGETYTLLRGHLTVAFHAADGRLEQAFELDARRGPACIDIPRGCWHTVTVHEPSVIFEAKDGPYTPLGPADIIDIHPQSTPSYG